ncbi:MAG: flagellar export chaperone FliS [Planctomycetes bacterium]|nr:flagellar export chaperone FliS [Planctomycetota bacterium]
MDQKTNTPNEYLKTKVLTASQEQLQLMLYDGAIRFCEQARKAIEDKQIEQSYNLIIKAEKIVMELCNSMRDEVAPETCANMRRLYIFCYEKLVDANLKKETKSLDEALQVLRHLRETWIMVMEKAKQEKTQAIEPPAHTDSPQPAAPNTPELAYQQIGANINFEG